MFKTTVGISGMICGMCEVHVNDAIRAAFPVKKVRSSRAKGETVILSDQPLDQEKLRRAVHASGYIMLSAKEEQVEKQSLLARLLKKRQ